MLSYEEAGSALDSIADELPQEIFEGLNGGVSFLEDAVRDEDGRYTLGMYFSDEMGRHIELYYGSFAELYGDMDDEMFKERLRSTLYHELTHHIENQAGDSSLERWDERQAELMGFGGIDPKSILFVCDDNSLSVVAEAVFNSAKAPYCPDVEAFSAGLKPNDEINPRIKKACAALDIALPDRAPQVITRSLAEKYDIILCMTALQMRKVQDEFQDLDEKVMCLGEDDITMPSFVSGYKKCVRRIQDEALAVIDEIREEREE